MSQEKVDRYKQEKANRKQIMRKQKAMGNCPQIDTCRSGDRTCGMVGVFCF